MPVQVCVRIENRHSALQDFARTIVGQEPGERPDKNALPLESIAKMRSAQFDQLGFNGGNPVLFDASPTPRRE